MLFLWFDSRIIEAASVTRRYKGADERRDRDEQRKQQSNPKFISQVAPRRW
jgi:hypothetical protein